ncbi:hypothetical protein P5V15_009170 [Pogonomyrmex californicus]
MLHLRKYITLVIRSQPYLSRCKATSCLLQRRDYVFQYVQPGLVRHAYLRPESYISTCNRTYSTTVTQTSQSNIIDQKLMLFCDDVKKGRISASHIKEIIELYEKNDYQLPPDIGVLLLRCCGNLLSDLENTERRQLADRVWRLAKKNSEKLTLEYYNTLLEVYKENSRSVDPYKFLCNMTVEPDENTYRLLFNIAIKVNNSKYLWDILSMTKDKHIVIFEEAANILVQIYISNGNIAEAEQMITLMQDAKLPTTKAYTELACRYAKLGDIPNLVKILNEEPQDDLSLLKIIKVLSISNNGRHIPYVLNFLITSVPTIEPKISKLIIELINANQIMDAHTIINCLAKNNTTKDVAPTFVNSFMNELIILNTPINDIIKYANDFIDFDCNRQALLDTAEIGLKLGREKLCLAVFEAMKIKRMEVRPHYYWPLLIKAHHEEGETQVFSLIKSMIDANVEVDSDTLLNFVFPYINTTNPIATLQKLLRINIAHAVIYTPLLSFLLSQNRIQDLELLYKYNKHSKVYFKELMKPLLNAYLATKDFKNCIMLLTAFPQGRDFIGIFLRSLLKVSSIKIEDLEELKKHKVKISQEDATIIKNRLQEKDIYITTKQLNLIDDLIDPSMENSIKMFRSAYLSPKELSCVLIERNLQKKNTKNILHKLLIGYCEENNLKKAEEIKQEYDARQYEWTPGMKLTLFQLYLKHDKLKEAEALLSDLQVPNKFHIDKSKILMYVTALIKAGEVTKAFKVINTFDTDDRQIMQQQCCTLLQILAQSRHHEYTRKMLNLLVERKYCEINTELLKPVMAEALKNNNILETVDIFKKCAQKYHKTPLALELLTTLLKQKATSNLYNIKNCIEQVYETIVTIYSVDVANTLLAIALGILNEKKKLQTLLQHELSMETLIYYIKNAKSSSDLDGLWNIFIITNTNNFDRNTMCEMLLSTYCKFGDRERILELWKIMCTKNIEFSEYFKNKFIHYLSLNKIPLPPELTKT